MKKTPLILLEQARRFILIGCCSFLIMFSGCGSSVKNCKIAIDPSWFPLDLYNKEPYLLAFSQELLKKISEIKKYECSTVSISWDNLLDGLMKKQYQGAFSSLDPYVFNLEKYDFSDNFFLTGPVVIIRNKDLFSENDHLYEKEVAVFSQSDEQVLSEAYPQAIIRHYNSSLKALIDLVDGNLDAVFLDYLEAFGYVNDIYYGLLKIVSTPLTNQGFKLVTLHKENPKLIHWFNEGLKELKENGEYDLLLKKWKLAN